MSFPRAPVVFPATVESRPVAKSTWGREGGRKYDKVWKFHPLRSDAEQPPLATVESKPMARSIWASYQGHMLTSLGRAWGTELLRGVVRNSSNLCTKCAITLRISLLVASAMKRFPAASNTNPCGK